jgi:hypothetical protein
MDNELVLCQVFSPTVRFRLLLASIALVVATGMAIVVAQQHPAFASSHEVNAGTVTELIDALEAANAPGAGPVVINLMANEYVLDAVDNNTNGPNGLPSIQGDVTIVGSGAVIQRSDEDGTADFRIVHVAGSGKLMLEGVEIRNGGQTSGGGIFNNGGTVTVLNSTISGNSATQTIGGGIRNAAGGTVTVVNSTISANSSARGGGIDNVNGTVTVINSTISGNSANSAGGGGIFNNGGTVTVVNSTIRGNSANSGGGIYNADTSTVTVVNSTISGNTANFDGGGIYNSGTLTVVNSTISGNSAANSGGGIFHATGTVTLTGTIVAGNLASNGPDVQGAMNSASNYNLIGNGSNMSGIGDGVNNNIVGVDVADVLDSNGLQDNGGPTQTIALVDDSETNPALNHIPMGEIGCGVSDAEIPVHIDQRGQPRPGGTENRCDIGAYELVSPFVEHQLVMVAPETVVAGEDATVIVVFDESWPLTLLIDGEPVELVPNPDGTATATFQRTQVQMVHLFLYMLGSSSTASAVVEVVPGPPATWSVDVAPATQTVGQAVTVTISDVEDEFGNSIASGHTFTIEIERDGSPSATASVVPEANPWTADLMDGTATLQYTNTLVGTDDVKTSFGGVDITEPNAVTWTAGPPASVSLSADPPAQTVDGQVALTAEVEDQFGNPVIDGIEVAFSIGDSEAGPALNLTGSTTDGTASVSYTRLFPGVDSVTASTPAGDPTATSEPVSVTWDLPVTAPLTQISASNSRGIVLSVGVSTTFGTNPSGAVSYRNGPHWMSTRSILSATVDGDHAVIFVEGNVLGVGQEVIRIDLYAGGWGSSAARVQWDGYDSGEFSMSQVQLRR